MIRILYLGFRYITGIKSLQKARYIKKLREHARQAGVGAAYGACS